MKQKIVIEVPLHCEKCRSKVMAIAAVAEGVISVAFERKDKDEVVIIGEGVDAARVTKHLRRKLKYADLVKVEQMQNKQELIEEPKFNQAVLVPTL